MAHDPVSPCPDCGARAGYIWITVMTIMCVACMEHLEAGYVLQPIYPEPTQLAFW